jgi:hypothetical protein
MPLIPRLRPAVAELIGIDPPKIPAPNRFIGEDHAALGHQLFDVVVAQAKAEIEPHTVADDLCGEPMTLIPDIPHLPRDFYESWTS